MTPQRPIVPDHTTLRPLLDRERHVLIEQGCTAADWSSVRVEDGFDPKRVRHVRFVGRVGIARSTDDSTRSELCHATLVDCNIGRNVRIANVGVHVAHYEIGQGACIEDIGLMETKHGAVFGNGVEVDVLNEAGGRPVILFNDLSAQFAYLMCLHRYRPQMIRKLTAIAKMTAAQSRSDVGSVGEGTHIRSVKQMVNINVGNSAIISGAAQLINGTVLSTPEAPTTVGCDVRAEDFIIAEGSSVTDGAMLSKSFVGQGCLVGKQYSAENSLFFANCEAFHGESVSVFGGPYTVTHHKSTLLIAGLFSFYNAGSGTNQSNHMYKLGPVHEGKLERGSKTGSFSYLMWPCRVGPFSVVLGKHTRHFDTSDLPFSLIEATPQGRCMVVPGLSLTTVGTVRDGTKWPNRDRRQGRNKRDRISFDVFSPYTVGRMLRGATILEKLHRQTDKDVETVNIMGADVKRVLLRKGVKSYRMGIEMYLLEKVFGRAERAIADGRSLPDAFAVAAGAAYSEDWLDIGGMIMPRHRLDDLTTSLVHGVVADITAFYGELNRITAEYDNDEWAWIRHTYGQIFHRDLDNASKDELVDLADSYFDVRSRFLKLVLLDAQREFNTMSHIGFGQDGASAADPNEDFTQVRGTYENNKFVDQIRTELAEIKDRVQRLKQVL